MIGLGGTVGVPYPSGPVIDYDGSSIAGMDFSISDVYGGTASTFWSTNGTEIEVGGGSGSLGIGYAATIVAPYGSSIAVIEADVRMPTAFYGTARAGITGLLTVDEAPSYAAVTKGFTLLANGNAAVCGTTVPGTFALATWYTLRIERIGDACRLLVDGTVVRRNSVSLGRFICLYHFCSFGNDTTADPVMFRNISVRVTDPARF